MVLASPVLTRRWLGEQSLPPAAPEPLGLLVVPMRAQVLLLRGDLDSALKVLETLDRARVAGDPQLVVPALTAAAMVESERGNVGAAIGLIRERIEMIGAREGSYAIGHTEAARVLAIAGEFGLLGELRSQDDLAIRRTQLCLAASGAVLAEAEGRTGEAAAIYAEAAAGWADFSHRPETAFAELGAGRCLLELGRPDEATTRLRGARDAFSGLGAVRLVEETDDLLSRATALSS